MSPFGMMGGGIGSMFDNMNAMMGNMRQSFVSMGVCVGLGNGVVITNHHCAVNLLDPVFS